VCSIRKRAAAMNGQCWRRPRSRNFRSWNGPLSGDRVASNEPREALNDAVGQQSGR
jgi:hypothetical protein